MTNGQPIPEDVWQAILRLEAKRIRQGDTTTIGDAYATTGDIYEGTGSM